MTDSARRRILLVEDEALIAMSEKIQLEKYGYAVKIVITGEKAVEAVKTSSDIDLILMDINLGGGIDGTQAADIILKNQDIPIVFLSSHTEPEIVEKTEKTTSYGYVVKNSSVTVLDASIKMAFKLFDAKQVLNEKEEVLSYKHEFMSYVIEHSRSAIAVHDKELKYLYVSQQYLESYRVDKRNVIGKHHYEVFPDLPQKWRDVHQKALRGEVSSAENDPFEREDGTTDWTRWECRPWYEQDGTIGGIIIYTDVITERKQAEDELRRFKTISDNAVYGNAIADLQGNLLYTNRFFANIHGYEPEDLTGKHFSLFHSEQQLDTANNLIATMIEEGHFAPTTVWHCHRDGTEFPMLMSGILLKDDYGNPQYIAAAVVDIAEHRRAETKLAESVELLSRAQEIAHIGYWQLDLTTNLLSWSDEVYRIFGCEPQESTATYEAFLDFVHPDDRAEVDGAYTRSVREGKNGYDIEHRIVRRDSGDVRYVHERCDHERDDAGTIIRSVGMAQDITERKRAEENLNEREAELQAILDNSPWLISEFDLDGRYLLVNPALAATFNLQPSQVKGKFFEELLPEEVARQFRDRVDQVRSSGEVIHIEDRIQTDSGFRHYLTTLFPVRYKGRDFHSVGSIAYDVTDSKQTAEALKVSKERFQNIIHNAPFGYYRVGKDELWKYVNPAWERMHSLKLEEVVGKSFGIAQPADMIEQARENVKHVLSGKPVSGQCSRLTSDGRVEYHSYNIQPVKENDEIVGVEGFINDITEQKISEKEIQRQLEEKEILLRELYHRVKNNVGNIESLLSLQAGSTDNAEVKSMLQDAISRVQSMRVLYEKLLLGKNAHEVSIKDYTESLVDSLLMAYDFGNNIIIDQHISDFRINSKVATTIGIIINELLTNVFKYAFKDRDRGTVSVSIEREEGKVTVIIKDDGSGLDERALENKSPGIGLTIVRMLVEQLDGTYNISNDNGAVSVLQFEM